MVTITRWIGRFGNNLFQYAAARVLAERNGLKLGVEWPHDHILKVLPWQDQGKAFDSPVVIPHFVGDTVDNSNDIHVLEQDYRNKRVIMDGYYQRSDYFNALRDQIRQWFEPCDKPQNTTDWVINYRVSDYWWYPRVDSVIDPKWHIGILRKEGFFNQHRARVYIVTEDPRDPCVNEVRRRTRATVVSGTEHEDFNFIRSFDNIINANGSFSWWASFLGHPKKCYFHTPWMRLHSLNLMNMVGATAVPGKFAYNSRMRSKNWDGYWLKREKK